jgi:quinol monooxygenase YgiN
VAIKVLLELTLKADQLEDAYRGIHDTLVDTRAFAGCLGVDVLLNRENPAQAVLVETWETFEAHDAYTAWRATPEGAPKALAAALAGAPVQRTFTLADDV